MEKSIVDDMRQLCASILSKKGKYPGYHAKGFAYLPISREKTKNGFIYKYPETPIGLESLKIITLSDQLLQLPDEEDIDTNSDGYLLIEFHFAKAKEWIEQQLQEEKESDISKQKIIFHSAGKVTYFTKTGSKHEYIFNINDNPYKLLHYLAQNVKNIIKYEQLNSALKQRRSGAESTPERRVSQFIGDIIKKLDLKHTKDLFIVNKGYGLDCIVEFR